MIIIPCGNNKDPRPGLMPAYQRYTGSFYRAVLRAALTLDGDIYIASALFGIIHACDLIPNYNLKMTAGRASRLRRFYIPPPWAAKAPHFCPALYERAFHLGYYEALFDHGLRIGYRKQVIVTEYRGTPKKLKHREPRKPQPLMFD